MIAMTLAARPDYLVADEPTTALDVTSAACSSCRCNGGPAVVAARAGRRRCRRSSAARQVHQTRLLRCARTCQSRFPIQRSRPRKREPTCVAIDCRRRRVIVPGGHAGAGAVRRERLRARRTTQQGPSRAAAPCAPVARRIARLAMLRLSPGPVRRSGEACARRRRAAQIVFQDPFGSPDLRMRMAIELLGESLTRAAPRDIATRLYSARPHQRIVRQTVRLRSRTSCCDARSAAGHQSSRGGQRQRIADRARWPCEPRSASFGDRADLGAGLSRGCRRRS